MILSPSLLSADFSRLADDMAGEELGVEMELPERIVCTFSGENRQCLRGKCPYYQG